MFDGKTSVIKEWRDVVRAFRQVKANYRQGVLPGSPEGKKLSSEEIDTIVEDFKDLGSEVCELIEASVGAAVGLTVAIVALKPKSTL